MSKLIGLKQNKKFVGQDLLVNYIADGRMGTIDCFGVPSITVEWKDGLREYLMKKHGFEVVQIIGFSRYDK